VILEHRIDEIAALGRLDEGEAHAMGAGGRPVDPGLEAGDIDAVNRIAPRMRAAELHRVVIGEQHRRRAADRDRRIAELGHGFAPAAGAERDERRTDEKQGMAHPVDPPVM
jgi:hypothetical protein